MKILILIFIFLCGTGLQASSPLPEHLRIHIANVAKYSVHKKYAEALEVAQKGWKEAKDLTELEHVLYGNLVINQLVNLQKWTEAQTVAMTLLKQYEEVFFESGLIVLGQRPAIQRVLQEMVKLEQWDLAAHFVDQVLELKPNWGLEEDHRMAGFQADLGNLAFQRGEIAKAERYWRQASESWDSKRHLWAKIEPEKFARFQGLDRFNPLQIRVEVRLFALYLAQGQMEKANEIQQAWNRQQQVMEEAHELDFAETYAKIINQRLAEEGLGVQLLTTTSKTVQCMKAALEDEH